MTSWSADDFRPPAWLKGPHAQTMVGRVLRFRPEAPRRRERWETADEDFLDVDIVEPIGAPRGSVIVLHGLEGSSTRSYVLLTLAHLHRNGLRGIAVNFRACSGETNRRARFYHSGETGDLRQVISRVKEEAPDVPLAAIGFSLGGNVLLKYLGETGTRSGLIGAAVVSVPYDLAVGARLIGSGVAGRIYTHYFLRSLKEKIRTKARSPVGESLDPALVRQGLAARSLLAYDDAVTAPLHGFRDAQAYYTASSSAPWIGAIRTPTVALHAADDPFLPERYLPQHALTENPHTTLHLTQRGGHLGFLQADTQWPSVPDARGRLKCWAERTATHAVSQFFE